MFAFFVTTRDRMLARAWQSADRGATAVEYGLIASLIAAVIVIAVTAFGTQLLALFDLMPDALTAIGITPTPYLRARPWGRAGDRETGTDLPERAGVHDPQPLLSSLSRDLKDKGSSNREVPLRA